MSTTTTITPPPPSSSTPFPRYHDDTWKLLSQGAEARVWLVPSFLSTTNNSPTDNTTGTTVIPAVCKERFPKAYRHPSLNDSLTRARTKAELRCLTRCRRAGVIVPAVLGVDVERDEEGEGRGTRASLFLEFVEGRTVREFLVGDTIPEEFREEVVVVDGEDDGGGPVTKKPRVDEEGDNGGTPPERVATRLDDVAIRVAYAVGSAVARMHNAGIVHGDLTTSNVLLRNPPPSNDGDETMGEENGAGWKPDVVLIDFGLSRFDGGGTNNNNGKKNKKNKNDGNDAGGGSREELAVDLYVLERAFSTTHAGSGPLVDELFRAYKAECFTSDTVLQRLCEVRTRGRKRECFG